MIEDRELRIGNLCKTPRGIIVSIDQIGGLAFLAGNGKILRWYNKLKPIEIDEDWLEKFGFHYAPDCLIYGKSGWFKKIEKQDDPTYFFFNNHLQGSIFLSSEKSSALHFIDSQMIYVHQLQNLYFSLTGQELTIK
jgi:hypothetical protein